jgi:hypothetical protein
MPVGYAFSINQTPGVRVAKHKKTQVEREMGFEPTATGLGKRSSYENKEQLRP